MRSERLVSEKRGVSDVVGVAILVGLSIVGALAIVAIGGVALNALTDQAEHDLADDSLRNVDARLSELADSPVDATTTITFPEGTGSKLTANETAGNVTVRAETKSGYEQYVASGSCTSSQNLGTITHERDNGNLVVYQGGGLWKQSPGGTQVQSRPSFDYDGNSISFSFVSIEGLRSIAEGEQLTATKSIAESENQSAEIRNALADCWTVQNHSGTVPAEMSVEITSKYADGWAEYARSGMSQSPESVSVSGNTVTMTFGTVGQKSGVLSNASDFSGGVVYSGLSQYAQYNDKIDPASEPNNFTVNQSALTTSTHSLAFYHESEDMWAYKDSSVTSGSWKYTNGTTVTDSTLAGVYSDRPEYNFSVDTAVCVVDGDGVVDNLTAGHCTSNMVGIDAPGPINDTTYDRPEFSVIDADLNRTAITEGEKVEVDVTVENTGNSTGTQWIALGDFGDNLVDYSGNEWTLDPNEQNSTTFVWDTGPGDSGTGELTVATEDHTKDTATLTVNPDNPKVSDFQVDYEPPTPPSEVDVGDRVIAQVNVTNEGNKTDTQYIALKRDGSPINATQVTVAPGNYKIKELSWNTTVGDNGTYTMTVASEDDTVSTIVEVNDSSTSSSPGVGMLFIGEAEDAVDDGPFLEEQNPNSSHPAYEDESDLTTAPCDTALGSEKKQFNNDGNGADRLVCYENTSLSSGFVGNQIGPDDYSVYVGLPQENRWIKYGEAEISNGTVGTKETNDYTYFVHSDDLDKANPSGGQKWAYNFYDIDEDDPVCIFEENDIDYDTANGECGDVTKPSNTDASFSNTSDGDPVVEIENATRGNVTLLTSQIGQKRNLTGAEREPLSVYFSIDESGSMLDDSSRDYEPAVQSSATVTVPEGKVMFVGGYNCNGNCDLGTSNATLDYQQVFYPGNEVDLSNWEAYVYDDNVTGGDPYGERYNATQGFIGDLNEPTDEVAAGEFGNDAQVLEGLTDEFDEVNESLPAHTPDDGTNIKAGINKGVEELKGSSNKKVMILLSDGEPTLGAYCADWGFFRCNDVVSDEEAAIEAAENAASKDVIIHTVGLNLDDDGKQLMQKIANKTEGDYYPVDNSSGLEGTFEEIAGDTTEKRIIERTETHVSAVNEDGKEDTLDETSKINDPDYYENTNATTVETKVQNAIEGSNSQLSFNVSVFGCDDYEDTDSTSEINDKEYTHQKCTSYDSDNVTYISNDDVDSHFIRVERGGGNATLDDLVHRTIPLEEWINDPASVKSMDQYSNFDSTDNEYEFNFTEPDKREAFVYLEVSAKGQQGYIMLRLTVPDKAEIRDDFDGNVSDGSDDDDTDSGVDSEFSVTRVDSPVNVTEGNEAQIEYTVENTGNETDEQYLTLERGDYVLNSTGLNISAGNSTTGTFEWNTTGVSPQDDITLELSTEDDTNTTEIDVESVPNPQPDYVVDNVSVQDPIIEGEWLNVTTNITNEGDATGFYQTVVMQKKVGPDTWAIVDAKSNNEVQLSKDTTGEYTFTWNTDEGAASVDTIRIKVEDSDIEKTVDIGKQSADVSDMGSTESTGGAEPVDIDISAIALDD